MIRSLLDLPVQLPKAPPSMMTDSDPLDMSDLPVHCSPIDPMLEDDESDLDEILEQDPDQSTAIGELILRRCRETNLSAEAVLESSWEMRQELWTSGLAPGDVETIASICDPDALTRDCSWAHKLILYLSPSMIVINASPDIHDLKSIQYYARRYRDLVQRGTSLELAPASIFQQYPKLVTYVLDLLGIPRSNAEQSKRLVSDRTEQICYYLAQRSVTPADIYWVMVHAGIDLTE